jgi:anti-sigma-K factor RskA
MEDEDQETLAAEYVLGTLSGEEREHAEALRSFDPEFEASVRQWERRLGELNVMVEAVEPPPEVWDKIKSEVEPGEPIGEIAASSGQDTTAAVAALAADLQSIEAVAASPLPESAAAGQALGLSGSPEPPPTKVERSADVLYHARRIRRWRRMTLGFGALAALLAAYIAVWQVAPHLMPPQIRLPAAGMIAESAAPAAPAALLPQPPLVAVLQHEPTAPAFLLTIEAQRRLLFVRRVAAMPEAGKSYELWLISSPGAAPRSLGIVGDEEFTERPLPENCDADTLRAASYAVSLEPVGGSPTSTPTGPILFTGKAVDSLPASPPQPKASRQWMEGRRPLIAIG